MVRIIVQEGSFFEDDPDLLLDMFFSDHSEVEDLEVLKQWVARAQGKRRPESYVAEELKLMLHPTTSQVEISGRWDQDWGTKKLGVDDFLATCDRLIAMGGYPREQER